MNIEQLERKFAKLRQSYQAGQIDAAEFQRAVDELQTQDSYGRYWMIGAESGLWYYFDGEQWQQADPSEVDKLPFMDDDGVYWMQGDNPDEWYYHDGQDWVKSEAAAETYQAPAGAPGQSPDSTKAEYFQDEQGRYWAQGAKSGKWYFYDETGWRSEDELPQADAPAQSQPMTGGGFRPVHPAPQYLQSQGPQDYTQPVPPQEYYQGPQYQPQQPTTDPNAYTQAVPAQPQQPGVNPNQPPPPEPGVWYYFDGEQWLRYEDESQAQSIGPAAAGAVGAAAYGAMRADQQAEASAYEEEYVTEDELPLEEEDLIEIEDLDDYVEVVEVEDEDIIDADTDTVEAEFEVAILTPQQEAAGKAQASAVAASAVATEATQPEAVEPGAPVASSTRPVQKTSPQPSSTQPQRPVSTKVQAQPVKPGGLKAIPGWFWTSLGGVATLVIAAILIVTTLYLLNNRDQGRALIVAEQTPTLSAVVAQNTPTPAPTPTPTPTVPPTATPVPLSNYDSPYFGLSLDYPAGWVLNEDDDLVIFAPSARALNRDEITGGALWVSLSEKADLTTLLADSLERFSPISETLTEGVMDIGAQSWASAQIRFTPDSLDEDAIALIASTVVDDNGYTLVAVAPASQWDSFKPLFQSALSSFTFSERASAVAATTPQPQVEGASEGTTEATATESASSEATTEATATSEATATPGTSAPAEPIIYEVQAGDTLGAIARQFGVTVAEIIAANNLSDNALIGIGQKLTIPQEGTSVAAVTATPTTEETASATSPTETATPRATSAPAETATPTAAPEAPLSGRIAYPAYSTDINSFDVWSANVDGSDPQIIVGNASQPNFSRDGKLFAYRSWNTDSRGIFFIDYGGGRQGQFTSFIADGLPAWSNDGTIVFSSRREGDRVPRLFRARQEGDGGYSLGFISEYPDVMADGHIVARGCTVDGDCGLWKLLPDGGGETKLTNDTSDTAPAAHPTGGRIALMSFDRDSAGNWEIWTINPDGSDPQRLTENSANDGLPAWSPDGQSIAFVSDRGGVWAIWAMNADGSNQRKLFNMQGPPDGQVLHDVPNSRGWLEERITWTP